MSTPSNNPVSLAPKTYEEVYYVDRVNTDRMLNPVAIRPTTSEDGITWNDTSRGTRLKISKIKFLNESGPNSEAPDTILIITNQGDQIALRKLTLDIYNAKVKNIVAGSPEFDSDSKVRDFYLKTNFEAY